MDTRFRQAAIALAWLVLVPAAAQAQGTIAGAVNDTSGAALPGVTVEATSPALIEKTRSVVTDGSGQYRIELLPPGTYAVTFLLPGFTAVKREGIEISGTFVATIDAELRVGEVTETITVTGEAPIVDVQSSTQQRVLDRQVLDVIPSGRTTATLGTLIPGMTTSSTSGVQSQDIGGSTVSMTVGLRLHGGRSSDQILLRNGTAVTASATSGSVSRQQLNVVAQQELVIDTSGAGAEYATGGVRINIVNREGSNQLHGVLFTGYGSNALQGSNFSEDLKSRGLRAPDSVKRSYDFNPGVGGAIVQDRLWFFAAARINASANYAADAFVNRNANNPSLWTYVADLGQPGFNEASSKGGEGRLTYQATRRQKLGLTFGQQANCECPINVSATRQPEAAFKGQQNPQQLVVADYTVPMSNRLLFEAGISRNRGVSDQLPIDGLNPEMISVVEQQGNVRYRGFPNYRYGENTTWHVRGAVSYVTGTHAYKTGVNLDWGQNIQDQFTVQPVEYRFNNGVPNRLTMRALNYVESRGTWGGAFAQDVWTRSRLTLRYGARFDMFTGRWPEIVLGPTPLTPTRDIRLPARNKVVSLKDVSPRFGAAYDLFGTQRTAVKVSLGRYLNQMAPGHVLVWEQNPALAVVTQTTRSWTDRNADFVPDCNLLTPAANGECGALADPNFGSASNPTAFDRSLTHGWGNRTYNWEFSTGVQHQLLDAMSVDISYFRRSYGNLMVLDDRALGPQDFDTFSITAPRDLALPDGGGYVLSGLYDVRPDRFGTPSQRIWAPTSDYGEQYEKWHGVDVTFNVRPGGGVFLQGGLSTGRTATDNCEVAAKVPEALTGQQLNEAQFVENAFFQPLQFCHVKTPYLTQVKFVGSYIIPKLDVQLSAAFQDMPGPELAADYVATNAVIAPSLGRPLAGAVANQTINIVQPGTMYGERLHQLDLRVGKIFRFGRTRTNVGVDIFNALNTDAVLTYNRAFGAAWLRPTSILLARFAKISAQIDF